MGYKHIKINHTKWFVHPETGCHTNAVEAYWSRLKRSLRQCRPVPGRAVWEHAEEIQYRLWFHIRAGDIPAAWENLCCHIAELYNVDEVEDENSEACKLKGEKRLSASQILSFHETADADQEETCGGGAAADEISYTSKVLQCVDESSKICDARTKESRRANQLRRCSKSKNDCQRNSRSGSVFTAFRPEIHELYDGGE